MAALIEVGRLIDVALKQYDEYLNSTASTKHETLVNYNTAFAAVQAYKKAHFGVAQEIENDDNDDDTPVLSLFPPVDDAPPVQSQVHVLLSAVTDAILHHQSKSSILDSIWHLRRAVHAASGDDESDVADALKECKINKDVATSLFELRRDAGGLLLCDLGKAKRVLGTAGVAAIQKQVSDHRDLVRQTKEQCETTESIYEILRSQHSAKI